MQMWIVVSDVAKVQRLDVLVPSEYLMTTDPVMQLLRSLPWVTMTGTTSILASVVGRISGFGIAPHEPISIFAAFQQRKGDEIDRTDWFPVLTDWFAHCLYYMRQITTSLWDLHIRVFILLYYC